MGAFAVGPELVVHVLRDARLPRREFGLLAAGAAARPGGVEAVAGALGCHCAFELGDRAEDLKEHPPHWHGGVDPLVEDHERDLALLQQRGELERLPDAISLSQRALQIMRQNVAISLATKAVFVVLAPLGYVTLVVAIAADMGISLLVTLNGLRLLGKRPAPRQTHAVPAAGAAEAEASNDVCCTPEPTALPPLPMLPVLSNTASAPCTDDCCAPKPGQDS